jgi:hypothetical protein
MTVGRISQTVVEVLLQFAPSARLSYQATELLLQQLPHARLGQQAVEVLRSTALSGGGSTRQSIVILCVTA